MAVGVSATQHLSGWLVGWVVCWVISGRVVLVWFGGHWGDLEEHLATKMLGLILRLDSLGQNLTVAANVHMGGRRRGRGREQAEAGRGVWCGHTVEHRSEIVTLEERAVIAVGTGTPHHGPGTPGTTGTVGATPPRVRQGAAAPQQYHEYYYLVEPSA